jgi:uncharacterized membrane protein YjgN (DUF898 family)
MKQPEQEPTQSAGCGVSSVDTRNLELVLDAGPDAAAAPGPETHPLRFTGTGSEYFRIWIVNLLLTIVTLGIYSAWAKVRKLKYFARSTRLADSVFDYHGMPLAILKGRLIALVLLAGYYAIGYVSLMLAVVFIAALAAALPWLVHRSLRFKLFHSSYRGIRFHFNGPIAGAYRVVLAPLLLFAVPFALISALGADPDSEPDAMLIGTLALVMLGATAFWPWLHHAFKRYQHANSAFGTTGGGFQATAGQFYGVYARTWGLGMLLLVALGLLLAAAGAVFWPMMLDDDGGPVIAALAVFVPLGMVLLFYGALLVVMAFMNARLQNVIWSGSTLGDLSFRSGVETGPLARIYLKNVVLLLLTLGLYTPFAVINTMRYRIESVTLDAPGGLDGFLASAQPGEGDASGEGAVDLFDIDIAL